MAGRQLGRFTDEQIERANRVDVVEYARSQGLEIKKSGKWYKASHQGGLYFHQEANTWHWEVKSTGGKGAISLCMEYENKTWLEAVKTLLGEEMEPIRHSADWKPEPEPPKEFHLPYKNDTYKHVFAYLTKTRGIDADILKTMVDKGYVYENTQKSCVFVGRDKEGVAKHASVRSTNTYGKVFKQDVPGSQKEFSFSISGSSKILNVFESPIDALSYMSLQKLHGKQIKDSYVALGGLSDKALVRFLADHPDIEKIRLCTDSDQAGEQAVARLYEQYSEKYKVTRHRPTHKDFNEDLVAYRQQQRDKEENRGNEQTEKQQNVEEMINQTAEPIKSVPLSKEMLEQEGISQRLIEWYEAEPDIFEIKDGVMQLEGSSDWLIVCDSPIEVFAFMHKQEQEYMRTHSVNRYESSEHFLTYKNADQIAAYVKDHPNISVIGVATSRTDVGEEAFSQIKKLESYDIVVGRMSPRLLSHSQDIKAENAINNALEQTPIEDMQADMAVGIEM